MSCLSKRVFDKSIKLADNAMLKEYPELFYMWDFRKNDKLGLDIYKITHGSNKVAWWICLDCESEYDAEVYRKTTGGRGCPYCAGVRVNHTNSLASLRPDLAKEWHPTKNGELTANDVTCGRRVEIWWLGACGHDWEAVIYSRVGMGAGCPYCDGKRILVGFNDMWTTNPKLASKLAHPVDGYICTQGSTKKVNWKCPDCENIIKNKTIADINKQGLSCPRCSDGISFPERFMYSLLRESGIEFVFDSTQKWSQGKRYDFFLPKYNWIIETHGLQHYEGSFSRYRTGRSLKEEQENDELKESLAKENGIENYIVIDARESTMNWIRSSIINSDLFKIIGEIPDFEKIEKMASKSFIKKSV